MKDHEQLGAFYLGRTCDPDSGEVTGESEGEFRGRLRELARERRDLELEKLRERYAPKLARVKDQLRRAGERVEREHSQYRQQKMQTAISLGSTILGALFGRKLGSASTVGRATTAARGAGRAAREREDILRATEGVEAVEKKLAALEAEFREKLDGVRDGCRAGELECEEVRIAPRKSDLAVDTVALIWTPWTVDDDGIAEPAYSTMQ